MNDREQISKTLQHYIDGAISGKGDDMKPAFHEDATIFGYVGDDLFAGPINQLFEWNDNNGPATDLDATISNIDIDVTSKYYGCGLVLPDCLSGLSILEATIK